ncbi:MAG: hypothetical protein IJS28_02995 [Synergistaceae bacterium]|nr:hypothetical protein [Synergistaceae bacterium]
MIGTLLITAAVIFGAGVVVGLWSYFVSFVKSSLEYVSQVVKRFIKATFAGFKCFLKWAGGRVREIVKGYTHDDINGQWVVTERETILDDDQVLDEIPPDILAKVRSQSSKAHDVTREVELTLENCA